MEQIVVWYVDVIQGDYKYSHFYAVESEASSFSSFCLQRGFQASVRASVY